MRLRCGRQQPTWTGRFYIVTHILYILSANNRYSTAEFEDGTTEDGPAPAHERHGAAGHDGWRHDSSVNAEWANDAGADTLWLRTRNMDLLNIFLKN